MLWSIFFIISGPQIWEDMGEYEGYGEIQRDIAGNTAGYSGILEIQRDTVGYKGISRDTAKYSGIQRDMGDTVAAWRAPPRCFPWGVCFFLFDRLYPMAQIPTGADDMAPSGHREHAQTVSTQNSDYGARYRPRTDPSPSA